jgi:GAF domain-containing protein
MVSFVGVPLLVNDEALGVVSFATVVKREFAPEEIDCLSMLAHQAAMAIHNTPLYEQSVKQGMEL